VVIIFGQCHYVPFRRNLEAAAPTHLDVGAFELRQQRPVAREDPHVEFVPVAVADQNIAGVADVDSVGEVGDILAADAPEELALLVKDDDAMALKVADVELFAAHGDVGGFPHVVAAVEPVQQVAVLVDDEDGGGHAVHRHDVTLRRDR